MDGEKKKYILYGAGYVGMMALEYYGAASIECFVDSNCFGTSYIGIPVISPYELCGKKNYEVIICSGNPKSIHEISNFLNDNGISFSVFGQNAEMNDYVFVNRKRDMKKLLIILAGYKEYLWENVFLRIKYFADDKTDVCILSAGKYCEKLEEIAEKNKWSYLSTAKNRVGMIQNMAIKLHPVADIIYKIDEDIFLTKNTLSEMERVYYKVWSEKKYAVGFVAPLINVNGYGYRRILEITDKIEDYKQRFNNPIYGQGDVFTDKDVCKYMWDLTIPIDYFASLIFNNLLEYSICFHRFSIGCILLSRENWELMNYIQDAPEGQLGVDEISLCNWCMEKQYAIIVAERAYAGHFSFAPQNAFMKKYYENNMEKFLLKGDAL